MRPISGLALALAVIAGSQTSALATAFQTTFTFDGPFVVTTFRPGRYSYGLTTRQTAPSIKGRISVKSIRVSTGPVVHHPPADHPTTPVTFFDVHVYLGPQNTPLPEGAVLDSGVPPQTYDPRQFLQRAPVEFHFVVGEIDDAVDRDYVANYTFVPPQYSLEAEGLANPTSHVDRAVDTTFAADGLTAQGFVWTGDDQVNLDVPSLTVVVDGDVTTCGDGMVEGDEECEPGPDSPCCTPACTLRPVAFPCGAATIACRQDAACDGERASCPPNVAAPDLTPCEDGDLCTIAEMCTDGACVGTRICDATVVPLQTKQVKFRVACSGQERDPRAACTAAAFAPARGATRAATVERARTPIGCPSGQAGLTQITTTGRRRFKNGKASFDLPLNDAGRKLFRKLHSNTISVTVPVCLQGVESQDPQGRPVTLKRVIEAARRGGH